MSRFALLACGLMGVSAPLGLAAMTDETRDAPADTTVGHPALDHPGGFLVEYPVAKIQLVRDNGRSVLLPKELDDGRPVVMNFIYTTCETTCPLSSATFTQFQARLGANRSRVHLVSISIDPEQDTPARLRAYARKFG